MRFIKQGVYQDGQGNTISGGTVSVYVAGTSLGTAASVYTASSGGTAVNSVTTSDNGSFTFYVDTADYNGITKFDIVLSKTNYQSRTVSNVEIIPYHFDHLVDVRDYGAVGDGTTDDTAAVQDAIDSGKAVFFPRTDNYYLISSVLTLATAGQVLYGSGVNSYIKGTGTNQNIFTASGIDDIHIYGLKIGMTSTRSSLVEGCGIYLNNCDRANIHDNLFTGGRSAGVQLRDCNYGSVYANKFVSSVVNSATDNHTQAGTDIYLSYSSSHNTVTGNTCISGAGVGIGVQTITSGDKADFNTIVGNIVRDQPQYGIMLYRLNVADTVYNNVIANNTVANISGDVQHSVSGFVYGAGIYVQGAEYTTVEGNSIYNTNTNNNIVFTLAPGGIGVANCRNVNIVGNTIRDPEWYGICCQDTGELGISDGKAVITANTIENSTKKDGIILQDFPRAAVVGNTINSCAGHGIHVKDGTAAISHSYVINGNFCENNTSCGINVVNCVSANLEGNHCNSNGTHGIHTDYGVYNIEGNTCRANTARGIGTTANATNGACANNILDGNNPNYTGNGNMLGLDTNIMINPGGTGNENGTYTRVRTFTSLDATPSVKNGNVFKTANAAPTTITGLDDGVVGQKVSIIINDSNTTIDFTGTTLDGNNGQDFVGAVGDVLFGVFDGTNWHFSSVTTAVHTHANTAGGGQVTSTGVTALLGAWDGTKADNTVYQATTDLEVAVYLTCDDASRGSSVGYTDSSNPPTTIRGRSSVQYNSGTSIYGQHNSYTFKVKKNDYWKVVKTQDAGTVTQTIYIIPVGS